MKETKKKVKKTTKQKQRQKQKQEQNVVVNINQPTKRKYTKRAPKAAPQNDNKPQQQFRGPIMAPTYNPPIVLREPPSTQNELFAKLFETKQERENNTQPNLLVGARVPNVETRQEKAHNDLERVRGKRVEKLDVATAPLPAKSELVHPEYQEATQSALAAFKERFQARAPSPNDALLKSLRESADTPFLPAIETQPPNQTVKKTEHDMLSAQTIISLVDQLNLGEQPEASEHSAHKAAPIADIEADILFSGEGQENEAPLEEAQPLESVNLGTLGQGGEELTSQLTTSSPPVRGQSVAKELEVVEGKAKSKAKRADFGAERGKQRPTAQIELDKFIDANVKTSNGKVQALKEGHQMTKGELKTLINTEPGYLAARAILASIGLSYVESAKAKYF